MRTFFQTHVQWHPIKTATNSWPLSSESHDSHIKIALLKIVIHVSIWNANNKIITVYNLIEMEMHSKVFF